MQVQRSSINPRLGGESFTFVHLTDIHIGEGILDYGPKGYDDVAPKGDVGDAAMTLRAQVDWINKHHISEHLKFVMITGDLTAHGQRSEFLKAKEILDSLAIPYVPLIGNHDIWPYALKGGADFTETPTATGDQYFLEVFGPTFGELARILPDWDDGTRLRPVKDPTRGGAVSYFQNFAFSYRGYYFICVDLNSRQHAPLGIKTNPWVAKYLRGVAELLLKAGIETAPGTLPNADLHDIPGGTLPWLISKLTHGKKLENSMKLDERTLVFAHHPLSKYVLDFVLMSFSLPDYDQMSRVVLTKTGWASIGAWVAGHIHRNSVYEVLTLDQLHGGTNGIETGAGLEGNLRLITAWGAPSPGRKVKLPPGSQPPRPRTGNQR
ncbi:MAG: metallophosphoesterase [Elusimicrobia bacterium]|nr:metallophosphoesterase [Elusimicrobiota bacterium]